MMRALICTSLVLMGLGGASRAQTVIIDDFDGYATDPELTAVWMGNGVSLQTAIATSAPNSMDVLTPSILPGAGGLVFRLLSPAIPFQSDAVYIRYQIVGADTTIALNDIRIQILLGDGSPINCQLPELTPTSADTWAVGRFSVPATCNSVDLTAITGFGVQLFNAGPTAGVIRAYFDDLTVSPEVTYTYAGGNFDTVAGVYSTGLNVTGQFSVDAQLAPGLPGTDISGQITDYSFDDGVQTFTPANSKIIGFSVATDTAGNIRSWTISVWATPVTMMTGGLVAAIELVFRPDYAQDWGYTDGVCLFTGPPLGECAGVDLMARMNFGQLLPVPAEPGSWSCADCVASSSITPSRVWTESGDAPSFPDGVAQVTRGQGPLTVISGSLNAAGGDRRDAYCVRVTAPDPLTALITTDPRRDAAASADFDTTLFLFRPDGAPVRANADTPPAQTPFLSTIAGPPGRYILVVSGQDVPRDTSDVDLFDLQAQPTAIVQADPAAGRFNSWQQGSPAAGEYSVILSGAEFCQSELDAVFANSGQNNRLCFGDDAGGFSCRDAGPSISVHLGTALGDLDGDGDLDAVFAVDNLNPNLVCTGNGAGGFNCAEINADLESSKDVALGFVDADANLDAVFASVDRNAAARENRLCLGDGIGGFFLCSNVSADDLETQGVALAYVDGDRILDAVFANALASNRVCLGDGSGSFTCSNVSTDTNASFDVAIGLIDGDGHPDAVFANANQPNRVCLGNGSGGFSCSNVSADSNASSGLALGLVNADAHLDAVFSNNGSRNRVCFGDGSGAFTGCSDVSADENASQAVALGLVNGDAHLDAVFANEGQTNRVCFGDGAGGFSSCSDVDGPGIFSLDVTLDEVAPSLIYASGFESGESP